MNKVLKTLRDIFTLDLKFFNSRKSTFKYLFFTIFCILLLVFLLLIVITNNFYNNHSDDILQYFVITEDYFMRIKSFDFSFYNLNNYFGASIFSDAYYVPIDIFTLTSFILSFIMEFEFAYSIVELLKILCGAMVFAYLLFEKKYSNKSVFITTMLYMCSGMFVCFMAFPAYLSMIFYMPLGYLVILKFLKKERFYLPIYICAIIFYNFYIAYTLIWFVCFVFLLEYFLQNTKFEFKKFVISGIDFSILLLIGVMLGAVILYPSSFYILENTQRETGSYELLRFDITYYLRLIAKLFVPSKSTSFYGFANSYITEHFSLNMSCIGLILMLSVFSFKDYTSKIFQKVLIIELVLLFFPIFYMIFSGSSVPYTRWMVMVLFFNLIILGHVINLTDLKINLYSKPYLIIGSVILLLILCSIFGYRYYLNLDVNYYSRYTLNVEYIYLIVIGSLVLLMYIVYKKFNIMKLLLIAECICAIVFMFNASFSSSDKIYYDMAGDNLNSYLDDVFDDTDDFYRIFIDNKALNDYTVSSTATGEYLNFNRTNSFNTSFGFFHSFYDDSVNEFADFIFDANVFHKQTDADVSSLYFNYLFNQKYVVTYSENMIENTSNSLVYLDPTKFTLFDNDDDSNYLTYQLIDNQEFIVYDKFLTSSEVKAASFYENGRMKLMLDNAVFLEDVDYLKHGDANDEAYSVSNKAKSASEIKIINDQEYYEYDFSSYLSTMEENNYFYFSYFSVDQIDEAFYIDVDGNVKSCLSNICYYDSPIDKFYIKRSGDVIGNVSLMTNLRLQFDNYDLINSFNENQNNLYQNKKITYNNDTFHISYTNYSEEQTAVMIPVSFSDNFKIDNEYELISINGGFLGVIIPKGEKNISFNITYYETDFYLGLKISILGVVCLTSYLGASIYIIKRKKSVIN